MADSPVSASNPPALSVYEVPLDTAPASGGRFEATDPIEWNEPLLRQNAIWFCQLRWIVVAVLTAVGVAGFFPGALRAVGLAIPPAWPLGTAAVLIVLNTGFKYLIVAGGRRRFPGVRLWLWMQIVSDLVILTGVVHWVGRDLPAAPFMYLFHVILAAIVFSSGESLLVAGLAAAFYLSSLALESAGVLTPTSSLAGADRSAAGAASAGQLTALVVPMLLIWAVIWYLASRLAATLRRRDRELAVSHRRLEASSEERTRHMLQTTHQLKSPFAAIHAQAQLLEGGYCGELPAPARAVVEKISARCVSLSRQIQEMLQLANLRSQGQLAPRRCEIDLATALEEAIARCEPSAGRRGIRLERQLEPVTLIAVADHLTMLLDNLIVNAVNYSHDQGVVRVVCRPIDSDQAVLVVSDQGIGIPPAKLPRVFDDYYRTEEAVRHNQASTGLGLAVVRHVARAMGATIQVESAPAWGTRVTVKLRRISGTPPDPKPH